MKQVESSLLIRSANKYMLGLIVGAVIVPMAYLLYQGSTLGGESRDIAGHYRQLQDALNAYKDSLTISSLDGLQITGTTAIDDKGNAFFILSHLVNVLFGNSHLWEVSISSYHAIVVRNFLMCLVGLLGISATFIIAYVISRSKLVGLYASLALLCIPAWSGSFFINPRDIAFAVGYTCVTAGGTIYLSQWLKPIRRIHHRMMSFMIIAGIYFSIGVRTSGLALIGITLFITVVLHLPASHSTKSIKYGLVTFIWSVMVGLCITILANPQAWQNPVAYLYRVFQSAQNFSAWGGYILLYGKTFFGRNGPWWYIPGWIFAQTPILILVVGIVGVATIFHHILKSQNKTSLVLIPFLLQGLVMPILSIIKQPTLYNGPRQFLFVFPILAICFGFGSNFLITRRWSPITNIGVWALTSAALLLPLAETMRLSPLQYVYLNPVARSIGGENSWELDYFGLSAYLVKVKDLNGDIPTFLHTEIDQTSNLEQSNYRWFDPNVPPAPAECTRNYLTREMGFKTYKIGYIATCRDLTEKNKLKQGPLESGDCSIPRIECLERASDFPQSDLQAILTSIETRDGTYGPVLCATLAVTNQGSFTSKIEPGDFTLSGLENSSFPQIFNSSNYYLYNVTNLLQPKETYSTFSCFDDKDNKFPFSNLKKLVFRFNSNQSTVNEWILKLD